MSIGETSSHGRDKALKGNSGTHSPGRFAQLVAQANPRLKFDAYSHHPYPVPPNQKPTQRVLWPNVSLASLPRFEQSLDAWFRRKNVPIWITEYALMQWILERFAREIDALYAYLIARAKRLGD